MSLSELFEVIFRWAHLIAGIMWIGNSMLFNWLDRNLDRRGLPAAGSAAEGQHGVVDKHQGRSKLSQGVLYMVHSGAFYDVEKKLLAPGEMPERLHWFKWQNGFTWLTGISLLVLLYYMNGAAFLIDPQVADIDPLVARTLSVSALFIAWLVYDSLWRTVGEGNPRLANAISIALLFASIYGYAHVFSGRGAYMQTGVMIGTVMTGNVWLCIMPSQKSLIAATLAGTEQDATLSLRAKQRSIHNNYLTFPLLFIMLSNHFSTALGAHLNWLVLIAVCIGGAGVRHFMNTRYLGGGAQKPVAAWLAPAFASALVAVFGLLVIARLSAKQLATIDYPVNFARAQEIINTRCVPCHSSHPVDPQFPVAPNNIMFDHAETIRTMAPRIKAKAVDTDTMPFLNRTHITDVERAELGKWIDSGAKLE